MQLHILGTVQYLFSGRTRRKDDLSGFSAKAAFVIGCTFAFPIVRRNPKGKMPLHGRVAGYRKERENYFGGVGGGGRISGSEEEELWVDHPHVLRAALHNQQQKSSTRHSDGGGESLAGCGYGFMDDHKRGMIQQWVECQAAELAVRQRRQQEARSKRMVPVQAPPEISSSPTSSAERTKSPLVAEEDKPEPFAWLREKGDVMQDDPECRVLAHFRTVSSSGSSDDDGVVKSEVKKENSSTTISADVHHSPEEENAVGDGADSLPAGVSVPPSPAVSSIAAATASAGGDREQEEEDLEVNLDKNNLSSLQKRIVDPNSSPHGRKKQEGKSLSAAAASSQAEKKGEFESDEIFRRPMGGRVRMGRR